MSAAQRSSIESVQLCIQDLRRLISEESVKDQQCQKKAARILQRLSGVSDGIAQRVRILTPDQRRNILLRVARFFPVVTDEALDYEAEWLGQNISADKCTALDSEVQRLEFHNLPALIRANKLANSKNHEISVANDARSAQIDFELEKWKNKQSLNESPNDSEEESQKKQATKLAKMFGVDSVADITRDLERLSNAPSKAQQKL